MHLHGNIFLEITELCLCFLFSECRYDSKDNFFQNYKSSNKKLDNFMIRLQNTTADFMLGLIVLVKTMFLHVNCVRCGEGVQQGDLPTLIHLLLLHITHT